SSIGQPVEPVLKTDIPVSFAPNDDNLYDNYMPFGQSYPSRDYTVDIIVCFAIPFLIAAMIVSSLTCIFFYNNQDLSKGCNETPVQLEQYNSISRATLRLRSLAQNRYYSVADVYSLSSLPPKLPLHITGTSTLPKAKTIRPVMRAHSFHQMSSCIDTTL
ncbi:unnamed protein product, partial [Oppiella nova]